MLKHSIKGDRQEIMGFLIGHAGENAFYINDAISFPVLGTETRVNATDECMGDFIERQDCIEALGKPRFACGWYHSHPEYGCWLSGIDVATQRNMQQANGAFTALVIDPIQTATFGKVFLGSFCTFTKQPGSNGSGTVKTSSALIPLDKIEDFGLQANQYYELNIEYYTTEADEKVIKDIITKSWGETISSSPLTTTAEFFARLVKQGAQRMQNVISGNSNQGDLMSLSELFNRLNQDRRAAILSQKMKRSIFG